MIKQLVTGVVLAALGHSAWAVDADIAFHAQARQAAVSPLCAALVIKKTESLVPDAQYQKALCLLYGLQTALQVDVALDVLRALSGQGMGEAQLALADTLQQGTPLQQQEALQWYGQASNAGDVRATVRHARLQQRLQALAKPPAADTTDDFADPYSEANTRVPGYHCHFYGMGKKVCHGGMD